MNLVYIICFQTYGRGKKMKAYRKRWKRISAFLLTLVLILGMCIPASAADTTVDALVVVNARQDLAREVLPLVNEERAKEGKAPLEMLDELEGAAFIRAAECSVIFSHDRLDGSSCATILDDMEITGWNGAGENIAAGQTSAERVMGSWMNSEGHRENIMNGNYTHIGIGCVESGGVLYWTQVFVTLPDASAYHEMDSEAYVEENAVVPTTISYGTATRFSQWQANLQPLYESGEEVSLNLAGEEEEKNSLLIQGLYQDESWDMALYGPGFTYSGWDDEIVSVSTDGIVTAKKVGETSVKSTWNDLESVTKIRVTCSHVYEDVKAEATCTQPGASKQVCTYCQDEKNVEEVPALGHDYAEKITKQATCTEAGEKELECTRCHDKKTETIPALGHEFSGVGTVVKAATCTETGSKEISCVRCDAKQTEVIPATGHDFGEWTVTKAATFLEAGEETRTCANCNLAETREIAALSASHTHDFSGKEEIVKAADCINTGVMRIHCTEPECTAVQDVDIPKTPHTPGEWSVTEEPTCTQAGTKHVVCTVCGNEIESASIEPLGHTWGEWSVAAEPTCTETGVRERICSICGGKETETVEALGHTWGKWTVEKEAACTETGLKSRVCKVCGEVEKAEIKELGHTVEKWTITKAASVDAEGERQGTCKVCGETITQTIPKLQKPASSTSVGSGGNAGKPQIGTAAASQPDNVKHAVRTGDYTNVLMYAVFAVAAAAIGGGVVMGNRKKHSEK